MRKRIIIKNGWGGSAFDDFSCDYSRRIFAKEKELYSANGAYALTNEGDPTKCFYSVMQSNNETTFSAVSARLCGFIQDYSSGLRTWPKNRRNPMGSMGL